MDALGRLGGDEFVALLPGTGEGDAHEVAKRIQKALAERVGATTGIATFPADGLEAEELIEHADAELYTAREGRPRTMPTRRELSWASTLARAVDLRMQLAVAAEDSKRVATLAGVIGERLGWDGHELSLLRMAANLHDVGKVSLPDHLLLEPAELSEEERAQLERHPIIGSELVGRVEGLEPLVPWIRHSHEHFDGSGYPDGLRGDAIPPAARILRVADAFDSLTSGRSRGEKLSPEAALDVLRGHAGGAFDPACVAALEQHAAESSALGAALAE
jgi:HD-GYP domain-containing protein (c-di-GMP phosphodiesterase class II)